MSYRPPYATPAASLRNGLTDRDRQRRSKRKLLANASAVVPHLRNDILPELRLCNRDPRIVVAPKRNVRGLDAAHVREVANAISTFGFTAPVLIDGESRLIDGVVRAEAAKLLKLPMIPCIVVDGLTPSEVKLLRVAINRLGEKNVWALDELKLELEELILDDAPIEIIGFELAEIDGILTEVEPDAVEPGPLEPQTGRAISCPGDIFILDDHRVICGDAREATAMYRLMRSDMARFVFTDQPYNVPIAGHVTGGSHREFAMASGEMSEEQFRTFNDEWIGQAARHLVDGGMLATFIDWRGQSSVTAAAVAARLKQINLVAWVKTNAGMGSLYRSQHELLPIFKKGEAPHVNNIDLGKKGRWRSNVWRYAGASSAGSDARRGLQDHPTVKPVAMLGDALLDLTDRGEIVLDPFLGSGSTLIAAEQTGRLCRGAEIDPLYVDLIVRRWQEVTGGVAILEQTGETFSAVSERRTRENEHPQEATPPVVSAPAPPAADCVSSASAAPQYRKRTRLRPAA